MSWINPPQPAEGERIIGLHPRMQPELPGIWHKRLRFHNGRHLTKRALDVEQEAHAQKLSLLGAGIGWGTHQGLEASASQEPGPVIDDRDSPVLRWTVSVAPGAATTYGGEDLVVHRALRTPVSTIPLLTRAGVQSDRIADGLGLLVLRPVLVEGADQDLMANRCDDDDEVLAFVDRRLVDASLLAFVPWSELFAATPPADAFQRNRCAWQYLQQDRLDDRAPGSPYGLPMALCRIEDSEMIWFDAHSVRRQLATDHRRSRAQAAIAQFQDHLAERLAAGVALTDLSAHMETLPPVGLLPVDAVDFATDQAALFPSRFALQAMPVVEEELETLFAASAGLAPVQWAEQEQLQLAVPVPAEFYDPHLLVTEVEDPRFASAIADLLTERSDQLGRRLQLRNMAETVVGLIDRREIPDFPNPDPENLRDEPISFAVSTAERDFDEEANDLLSHLIAEASGGADWVTDLINNATDAKEGEGRGLEALVRSLDEQVNQADDTVDLLFTRLRADIHRVRQVMQDSVSAARMATSPVLHEVAEGLTTKATPAAIKSFFSADVKSSTARAARTADSSDATPAPSTGSSAPAVRSDAVVSQPLFARSAFVPSSFVANIGGVRAILGRSAPQLDLTAAFKLPTLTLPKIKAPIAGKVLPPRTTSLTERLKEPPAAEAKNHAVATKHRVFTSLANLPIHVGDLQVPVGTPETVIVESDLLTEWANDNSKAWSVISERVKSHEDFATIYIGDLTATEVRNIGEDGMAWLKGFTNRVFPLDGFKNVRNANRILAGVFDADPSNGAESDFLAAAVAAEEAAVAALRQVEGRIDFYRGMIRSIRIAIEKLQTLASAWEKRLTEIDEDLAETRHDLTVAWALRLEEQKRVATVNQRREKILAEEVRQVAFLRPRHVPLTKTMHAVTLQEVAVDPVPTNPDEAPPLVQELEPFIDLLREIPLGWFRGLDKLLDYLDRRERLQDLFERARQRSRLLAAAPVALPYFNKRTPATRALHHVTTTAHRIRSVLLERRRKFVLSKLAKLSWKQSKRTALEELSLEDLHQSSRGGAILRRKAGAVLAQFEAVLAVLHAEVALVPPATRFAWVERLSVHDKPLDLRDPTILAGFGQLSLPDRQRLHRLIGWLFEQVDADEARAVAVINDLVRAAILVAGHAPAGELAHGHVKEPVKASVGEHIDVVVDRGSVRIGMQLEIAQAAGPVRAVVTDLASTAVRVQLLQASRQVVDLAAGSRITFSDRLRR